MARCIGKHPVIGIRPIIDARHGLLEVRQSLEKQTMDMAKSASELFINNLFYSDGKNAEVIIPNKTIGRVAEAAECAEMFRQKGVNITLSVTPCWCYGSETMDMDSMTIKAVWGFNGTERPGAVYLAAVLANHAQKGLPAFGIYGKEVKDSNDTDIPDDVKEKLLRFGRSAIAAAEMKGKSYLQIGAACMGIAGSIINTDFFEEYLGMRIESIDEIEILRRINENIYDKDEFDRAMFWVTKNCYEGIDKNPEKFRKNSKQKAKDFEFSIKTACIIKDLFNGNNNLPKGCEEEALGHNAIAGGFQGQRQWTDFFPNTDFAESILNTSFDWNGAREPYILATENDTLNGVCMLFGKLLTGRSQIFADVRTFWSPESVEKATGYKLEGKAKDSKGFIHLINSGAAALDGCGEVKDEENNAVIKPFWNMQQKDIEICLKATTWCASDLGYFKGGGFSSRFITKNEMPVTMIRLNIVKGLGPIMQLAEGYTINLPDEISDIIWKRTDYTWPCTWFSPRLTNKAPFNSTYDVMNNWGANHSNVSYGHIGADIITLCSILRIPVCMHNINEEEIFRPSVWNSFGSDKEGQDYRACATYGPLYR